MTPLDPLGLRACTLPDPASGGDRWLIASGIVVVAQVLPCPVPGLYDPEELAHLMAIGPLTARLLVDIGNYFSTGSAEDRRAVEACVDLLTERLKGGAG